VTAEEQSADVGARSPQGPTQEPRARRAGSGQPHRAATGRSAAAVASPERRRPPSSNDAGSPIPGGCNETSLRSFSIRSGGKLILTDRDIMSATASVSGLIISASLSATTPSPLRGTPAPDPARPYTTLNGRDRSPSSSSELIHPMMAAAPAPRCELRAARNGQNGYPIAERRKMRVVVAPRSHLGR
jgi:hypothetical protein